MKGPLIDSDFTPKSMARRFQSPGSVPSNIRKSTRNAKGKIIGLTDDGLESTDDEYFTQPTDPRQPRNRKKPTNEPSTSRLKSSSQISVNSAKTHAVDDYNMLSHLLNEQTERLERQIVDSKNTVLSTMEEKMDNIHGESERRMSGRLQQMENATNDRFIQINERIATIENANPNVEAFETRIDNFTTAIHEQMDQITNTLDTKLALIKEKADKIATIPNEARICPNEERISNCEGRMTNCEGGVDDVRQDQRNFSLILSGLRPEFQNSAGVIGFARDVLNVYIDPNEIADVIKIGSE